MDSVARVAVGYGGVGVVLGTLCVLLDDFYIGNREDALPVAARDLAFIPVLINSFKKNNPIAL